MPNDFKILHQKVALGETVTINMDIARLTTRSKIDVRIIVSRGKEDGPCLLLIGGIHGDETNGIEIVRQIVAEGLHKPEKGTIICIPFPSTKHIDGITVHSFGFNNRHSYFPLKRI